MNTGKPPAKGLAVKLNRVAATTIATAATAAVIFTGLAATQHSGAVMLSADSHPVVTHSVTSHSVASHPAKSASKSTASADPSLAWLESRGGQAQLTLNDDVDLLAAGLETESHAPTVANHLVFEAEGRVVRAEATKILSTRALLPTHNRAAYQRMLKDFITVANLLQPGPDYGTTPQDYTAWNTALKASDITVW
jgi:hypothetical protein